MTDWADFSALHQVARALTLGDLDHYTPRPMETIRRAVPRVRRGRRSPHGPATKGRYDPRITILGNEREPDVTAASKTRWSAGARRWGCWTPRRRTARAVLAEPDIGGKLPVVLLPTAASCRPTCGKLARAYGGNQVPLTRTFDVVVLGAGPAGLSAAVYGASEGLNVLLVEPQSLGGQASSSPMIRNYLGFPDGVSGSELVGRAWEQAWRFGVRSLIGPPGGAIRSDGDERIVEFEDGTSARTTVVSHRKWPRVSPARHPEPRATHRPGRVLRLRRDRGASRWPASPPWWWAARTPPARPPSTSRATRDPCPCWCAANSPRARCPSTSSSSWTAWTTSRPARTEIVDARDDHRLRTLVLRERKEEQRSRTSTRRRQFVVIGAAPRTDWLPAVDRP